MVHDPAAAPVRFEVAQSPRASVVITGWRDAPHLDSCLAALAASRPETAFEVLVALNEPSPDRHQSLADPSTGIALHSAAFNRGFAGACNAAVAEARGELVVLLNDDARVEPGWLDTLVAAADARPSAGAVGGMILGPDGDILEDGTVLWSDGTVTLIDDRHRPRPEPDRGPRRVDYCSAASLLVRRSTWDSAGGFDEGYYPAYCEDVDLCLKIAALGQEVVYEPAARIRHLQGASASWHYRVFLRDRNTVRLRRRWPRALADRPAPAPDDPQALGRAVQQAARRPLQPGPGPEVADVKAHASSIEQWYRAREAEVTDLFARSPQAAQKAAQARIGRRLAQGVAGRARALVVWSPTARRWFKRLRDRWAGSRGRRIG